MYEIHIADQSDGDALRRFIDEHWRKDHIFVTCPSLLDWQHLDRERGRYNFIIGVEKHSREIHAVLGFIPLSQFDGSVVPEPFCWMALWKVREDSRGHQLGRRLLQYLEEEICPDVISIGATEMTLAMYEARGYQSGLLRQYYILNPIMPIFKLATVNAPTLGRVTEGTARCRAQWMDAESPVPVTSRRQPRKRV